MSQHVCARRILLEQQEDQRRDEQDGDGQHAERGVAGQGRVVATRKVPMIEASFREETIVRPGNPFEIIGGIMVSMHAINTCC